MSKRRLFNPRFFLSLGNLLTLAGVAVCSLVGCNDEAARRGVGWIPPAEETMPLGFAEEDHVPDYVRCWRMPPGFRGFPKQWNGRVQSFLDAQIGRLDEQIQRVRQRLPLTSAADEDAARTRLRLLESEAEQLRERRQIGDYLIFLTEKDLPDNLQWVRGEAEPELGDPAAIRGGTLRLALQRSFPNTLRIFGPNSNNSTRRYIYDDIDLPLVRLHPGTRKLIPGTADRWAISPGGRTIYFHIDPAARFSNGDALTTRDFVASLFLRTSPHSAEPFYPDFYLTNFTRIAIYGNHVLAVTLPTPRPYAAYYAGSLPNVCTRFYAEYGPDYPERYLWRAAPVTGGYAVDAQQTVMGSKLVLSRVKNWWAEDRRYTRHTCNVDHISYTFITEASKIRELFRIGELDAISGRDADFWYEGLEIPPVHAGLIRRVIFQNEWPRNCFGFHLNCSAPPFNNLDARRGFHYALNVQEVIDTLFRGDYRRASSYFSGFGEFTDPHIRALPFDPARARACFAAAGYTEEDDDGILHKKDGTRLQVMVSSRVDPTYAAAMSILKADAARCGLDLQFEQMDDTLFYLKVKNKNYTACIFSWGFSPPVPDASAFFLSQYAYDAEGKPLPGTSNITATASPALDRAILEARSAPTLPMAIRAQHRVQQLIADSCAWVPGWSSRFWRFAQWRWLCWPNTEETRFCPPLYYDPLDSHLYWIDPKLMQETQRARAEGRRFPESELIIPLPTRP